MYLAKLVFCQDTVHIILVVSDDIERTNVVFTSYYEFKQHCYLFTSFDTIILCTLDMIPHEVVDTFGNFTNAKLTKVISVLDINSLTVDAKKERRK